VANTLNLSLSGWFGARRVPVVLQTEAAECALACLAMVPPHTVIALICRRCASVSRCR